MKNIIFLNILIILVYKPTYGQVEDFITEGVYAPFNILAVGNDLYIAEYFQGKINKVNLNQQNPTITNIISGLEYPTSLALRGDYLYVGELLRNKVSKFDVRITNPTLIDVVDVTSPRSMSFFGNELFIWNGLQGVLHKTDVSDTTPTISNVNIDIPLPFANEKSIVVNGNYLYISSSAYDRIYVTDLSSTNLELTSAGLIDFSSSITFDANGNLYCSVYNWISAENVDNLSILNSENNFEEIASQLNEPQHITISDNIIYIYEREPTKISKLDLSSVLSINEFDLSDEIKIFPNPSSNFINISGLTKLENYIIYDILGNEIINGTIGNNQKINIQNLSNGFYLLKVNNKNKIKLIKN